jgi:uncharacterized protein (DUF1501 family)
VLVVVNLQGGNDGLSTLVPLLEYDRYRALRPRLAYAPENVLALPGQPDFGLNPGLTAFRDLYSQGRLAIVNGVGVPREATGLFDHAAQQFEFQSCDIVRAGTGRPPTGWLGRFCDPYVGGDVSPGIDLGGGRLMLTGEACDPLTIGTIEDLQLQLSFDAERRRAAYERLMALPAAHPVAERHRDLRVQAMQQSERILQAVSGYVPAVQYPQESWLAFNLQQCAKIIVGDLGVRALAVGLGGFDTHDAQDEGRSGEELGYHARLLREVSDSVAAFYADLRAHGVSDRVLILTISEFGRTAYENGSSGSDHGYGSVGFVLGDAVNGGIYGAHPGLEDGQLVFDGLTDVTTDFRSVYATAAASFAGVDPEPVVGGSFPLLGFI